MGGDVFGIPRMSVAKRFHEVSSILRRWSAKIWTRELRAHWRRLDALTGMNT